MRVGGMNLVELLEVRDRSRTLSHVVSEGLAIVTMMATGDATLINGASVSRGTFPMLGVQPALGRWFRSEEEQEGSHVIVLSHDA
jgi:hypothetical protein